MTSPRVIIFTGRFGSGKTEIALNYAIQLAERGQKPLLVDLDIITPYFRTRDRTQELGQYGVEVITPFQVGHHLHIPALSPYILGAIEQVERPVVLDVGGDVQGARALSQYAPVIESRRADIYMVVNPYRPFMGTVNEIVASVREIEVSAALPVSALVSNPNMMSESTPSLFQDGHRIVAQAAAALELPVALAVMSEALAAKMTPPDLPILIIHRFFLMFDDPKK